MPDPNHGGFTPTDRINYAGSIAAGKRQSRVLANVGGPSSLGGNPLEGLSDAADSIIGAAGLGRRAPEGPTRGEQMSDADEPEQRVKVGDDGEAVHQKRTADGVSETAVGGSAPPPWYKSHYGDSSGRMRDYSPTAIASNGGSAPLVKPRYRGQFSGDTLGLEMVNPD